MTCVRCNDTGWITYTAGDHRTPRGNLVTATEDDPVFKRCPCKRSTPAEERQREVRIYE